MNGIPTREPTPRAAPSRRRCPAAWLPSLLAMVVLLLQRERYRDHARYPLLLA